MPPELNTLINSFPTLKIIFKNQNKYAKEKYLPS
jgi:hypothetical protein